MPEYLAPGVYVEETSFRARSIEGVSTTTTAFVGPTRYGPIDLEPDIITSLVEFERIYGDRQQLDFTDAGTMHNYMWHAVRAFFEEGGKRLYVARVFRPFESAGEADPGEEKKVGYAKKSIPSDSGKGNFGIEARFPGEAGNMLVRITVRLGQNVLGRKEVRDENGELRTIGSPPVLETKSVVSNLVDGDVVWISEQTSPISSPPGSGTLYIVTSSYDPLTKEVLWKFSNNDSPPEVELQNLNVGATPETGDQIRTVTLTVTAVLSDGSTLVWDRLSPTPKHVRDGVADSLEAKFEAKPSSLGAARALPIVVTFGSDLTDGLSVLQAIFYSDPNRDLRTNLNNLKSSEAARSVDVLLEGGNDGERPLASDYEGKAKESEKGKSGLKALEDIEDISIVAAPGSTHRYNEEPNKLQANTIVNLLLSHAARMKYRIAVLDSGDDQTIADVRAMRAKIDSTYGALYYPWVKLLDPVTQQEIMVPPSGHVAGIYARNDINRAVYKAPANEVVNLAIGFEKLINKAQQEVLNPEGINCFRFFEGRGFRLWGARTVSSDPEWKYVNLRRYFCYLGRSIDRGTQWAVFELNGDALWRNLRETIQDFLFNEWVSGALLGDDPKKAYFVKCDRSTMTQNDLDNGRLICLIGVAVVKPAEFVIFRIGQWTADRKV